MSIAAATAPLSLLGKTRRTQLHGLLTSVVTTWRGRWSVAGDSVTVMVGDAAEGCLGAFSSDGLIAKGSSGDFLLQLRWNAEVFTGVFGVPAVAELAATAGRRGAASEVQLQALRELCTDLLQAAGIRAGRVDELAADTVATEVARQSLTVKVSLGMRARLALLLGPACLDLLAPRKAATPTASALTAPRLAIAGERVRVEAMLGEVEISLSDLARLSEGDVVVLDQPLTAPGFLEVDGGKRIAGAILGAANGRKAVSVTRRIGE